MNSKLDQDNLSSRPFCLHRFLSYIGSQTTAVPGKFVYLYNCNICHSTLAFSYRLKNSDSRL